jgi:hypothetical protein
MLLPGAVSRKSGDLVVCLLTFVLGVSELANSSMVVYVM